MSSPKKVLLLGASGSIGSQTIDIINEANGKFVLTAFSVGRNYEKAVEILKSFPSIKHIYVIFKEHALQLKQAFPKVEVFYGEEGLKEITSNADYDICVDALVGISGLEPAIIALKRNKILCLANKEALVTGGNVINKLLDSKKGKLYPIDSEHVALAKCLSRCKRENVKRIIITASGGALRDVPIEELENIKAARALEHPTWKMGNKITIDCATMMNKGFEVIEAYYLYNFPLNKIDVLMHDESLIHSAVELIDGTFLVDYGKPDMHNPIRWAMYEGNIDFEIKHVKSLKDLPDCHFREYNSKRYPCLELAKKALVDGPSKMIALNGANEVLVNKYLKDEIKFTEIASGVKRVLEMIPIINDVDLSQIKTIDSIARKEASNG